VRNPDQSKEGMPKRLPPERSVVWTVEFFSRRRPDGSRTIPRDLPRGIWLERAARGIALTVGGIAGILTQTPAGALVDRLRSKRALIAAGIVALAVGALLIALVPTFGR